MIDGLNAEYPLCQYWRHPDKVLFYHGIRKQQITFVANEVSIDPNLKGSHLYDPYAVVPYDIAVEGYRNAQHCHHNCCGTDDTGRSL